MRSSDLGLEHLVGSDSGDQRFADAFPHEAFYNELARPDFVEPLMATPVASALGDLPRLANLSMEVEAEATFADGPAFAFPVTLIEAQRLVDSGRALVRLPCVERWWPQVSDWLSSISASLTGVVVRDAFVNAYVSPRGFLGVPHLDGHEVFMAQVLGRKRWRIWDCQEVAFSDVGIEWAEVHRRALLEFGECIADDRARQSPESARTIVMNPGSVLYLPRGVFHESDTLETSCHLTFGFSLDNWAQAIGDYLRFQLRKDRAGRRVVTALCRDPYQPVTRHLEEALRRILRDPEFFQEAFRVSGASTSGGRQKSSAGKYVKFPEATISREGAGDDGMVVRLERLGRRVGDFRCGAAHWQLLARVADESSPFKLEDAVGWAPGLRPERVAALVDYLVGTGFLEVIGVKHRPWPS